ncbi:MAG: type 4a pilus biogenesis protein PilO [Phycisphaerales bacterium]
MRFGVRELVMFLAVLLLPVGAYFVAFRPQNVQIEKDREELAHRRELLAKLRAETARNDDLERANAEIAGQIEKIESRLPTSKGVDQIVRQVSSLAVEAGLAPPSLKSMKPVAAARYREQPLELTTNGTFEGYYTFLQSLERLPRITRIVDLKMEEAKDGGIEFAFTLSIYFREDEEATS